MNKLYEMLNNNTGNIGVDIDDTKVDFNKPLTIQINKLYSDKLITNITESDLLVYRLEDLPILKNIGITKEKVREIFKSMEAEGIVENLMPKPYCIAALKKLEDTSTIYDITARSNAYYNDPIKLTSSWRDKIYSKYRFKPTDIIYESDKEKVLQQFNITLMFEDNLDVVKKILEQKTQEVNVILFNTPKNIITYKDKNSLPNADYIKKKETVEIVNSYLGKTLARVNDWKIIHDYVYYKDFKF